MRTTGSILTLVAAMALAMQDPPHQDPPHQGPPSKQDPPASQPAPTTPPATPTSNEPPPGTPKRHRYEGVYRLRSCMVDGMPQTDVKRGYLAITSRHLLLVIAGDGPIADVPLVSAGVRRWQAESDGLRTTIELDFFSDQNGDLHFAEPGLPEFRSVDLTRGGLRLIKDAQSWLDFERIE